MSAAPGAPAQSSCLYEGWVSHRRLSPVEHSFRYPVQMALLDLDELPEALGAHPLWSARRPAVVGFRPSDHLGVAGTGRTGAERLAAAARELVASEAGVDCDGPVRLLTTLRFCGIGFNPVSFFYLHRSGSEQPAASIAEVTSTPWGERHAYVLRGTGGSFEKRMHVSPFMPMEQTYRFSSEAPGERLAVGISSLEGGRTVFSAGLQLRRLELTRAEMTRSMLVRPPAALATLARIYSNALRLRLKGAPYHRRPAATAR